MNPHVTHRYRWCGVVWGPVSDNPLDNLFMIKASPRAAALATGGPLAMMPQVLRIAPPWGKNAYR